MVAASAAEQEAKDEPVERVHGEWEQEQQKAREEKGALHRPDRTEPAEEPAEERCDKENAEPARSRIDADGESIVAGPLECHGEKRHAEGERHAGEGRRRDDEDQIAPRLQATQHGGKRAAWSRQRRTLWELVVRPRPYAGTWTRPAASLVEPRAFPLSVRAL